MDTELHKLRIDKSQKARRDDRPVWPWFCWCCCLIGGGVAVWQWKSNSHVIEVQTVRVYLPEGTVQENDLVMLNATGYIMAAHRMNWRAR